MSSSALQWMIIRKSSCYISRKRNVNKPFSKDPWNLKGVHSPKYDGLINKKAIGISSASGNQGLTVMYKNRGNQNKPVKSTTKINLRKGNRRSLNSIKRFIECGKYRPDLKHVALKRVSLLLKSQRPVMLKKKGSRKKADKV